MIAARWYVGYAATNIIYVFAVAVGTVLGLSLQTTSSLADKTHRICVGEKTCPVNAESLYPCYTTVDSIAKQLCAVHKPDGTVTVYPWTWQFQGQHEGDHCGYFWGNITCLTTTRKPLLPEIFQK
jgi:hypothetical protein